MKLCWTYIKQRRRSIIAFVVFIAVLSSSFALYHLPLEAVIYPVLLCLLFGIIFISADFVRVMRKHKRLVEIKGLSAAIMSSMPEAESIEDADYQDVIHALQAEIADLEAVTSAKYQDMTEYYTVWVHQIKTPITSMRLSLQNEDTALSRKLSQDLFQIEQYVEMVLAFLRLDSVSGDYVFKEYSIDSIIKQAVAKFASEFINRKIGLEFEETRKKIITDEKWLSFVIEQVLSNALKYTREGSIKIYVKEPDILCIKDTGIGIAPEDLPRIFEKGYTGYNGRREKKASGIGLYLCKRICDNLGAKIEVASELDRGTEVCIDLKQYKFSKE